MVGLAVAIAAAWRRAVGDSDESVDTSFVGDIRAGVEAVEAELGAGQEYFEVTAGPKLTNIFVAVDDATAAIPYVYPDGELLPPAPALTGASGFTFTADAIDFDEEAILAKVAEELPGRHDPDAQRRRRRRRQPCATWCPRQSAEGGVLDITVGPDGSVLAVDPV